MYCLSIWKVIICSELIKETTEECFRKIIVGMKSRSEFLKNLKTCNIFKLIMLVIFQPRNLKFKYYYPSRVLYGLLVSEN